MKNVPYTYLIYCIPTKQFYYGVRYSKDCNPNDLWKTYFTSSTYVKDLILKYGKENFKTQIRKTFKSCYSARKWEQKVLTKLNVSERKDFINKTNNSLINGKNRIWMTNGIKNAFVDVLDVGDYVGWNKGRTFDISHKLKISETRKKSKKVNIPPPTIEQKIKWSKDRKGKKNGRDTSKSVTINHKTFISIRQAMSETGLSRYMIKKINP